MPHRSRRGRALARGPARQRRPVRAEGGARVGRQRLPAEGREGALEGPGRARGLRRRPVRRCAAGRDADRVCGHDRARQRGARALAQGPEAGHRAAHGGRRVAERRRGGGADPLRGPAEERGVSDAASLTGQALEAIGRAQTEDALAKIELEYLGRRSGLVSSLLSNIGSLPAQEKAALGKGANEAKRAIESALAARRAELEQARLADLAETEAIDVTFPGPPLGRGHIHVLTQTRRQIETVLESLGYQVELGPEVETGGYNFGAR